MQLICYVLITSTGNILSFLIRSLLILPWASSRGGFLHVLTHWTYTCQYLIAFLHFKIEKLLLDTWLKKNPTRI